LSGGQDPRQAAQVKVIEIKLAPGRFPVKLGATSKTDLSSGSIGVRESSPSVFKRES
jgi:hypothetical protein